MTMQNGPSIQCKSVVSKQSSLLKHLLLILCFSLSLFLLQSCSSIPTHKPVAPKVSIAKVRPLNLSLSGQKLLFTLSVKNPNAYDLPMQSLNFIASLAGEEIIKGFNNTAVTLPAEGETLVEVTVTAGLNTVIKQLKSMNKSGKINLEYGIKGFVKLANWPANIPFDVSGDAEQALKDKLTQ